MSNDDEPQKGNKGNWRKRAVVAFLLSGGGRRFFPEEEETLQRPFYQASNTNLPERFAVPYVAPDRPVTNDELMQFQAGLANNSLAVYSLMNKGVSTRPYYQGLLSYACFNDKIDDLEYLLSPHSPCHEPLSITYKNNNALFNAVLGGGKKATSKLLGLGADPKEVIRTFKKFDFRSDEEGIRAEKFRESYALSQRAPIIGNSHQWSPSS